MFPHERKVDSIEQAKSLSRTRYCWVVDYLTDYSAFDFLWEPVPWQSQYTHVWPTAWPGYYSTYLIPRDVAGIDYHIQSQTLTTRVIQENFETLVPCEFDYTWTPHPWDPPYIYVFGNQHWPAEIMPTVKYTMPGATEEKFVTDAAATLLPNRANWKLLEPIDEQQWDWSWVPDPGDPAYIYVFGNQWNPPEFKASIEYHVPGATERKYMEPRSCRLPNYGNQWRVYDKIQEFDYSWEPNPFDPPYIYVFGNQWYSAEIEPTVEYHVAGAKERKYVNDIVAQVQEDKTHYHELHTVEAFDYSWHPDPGEPPYIYVFGNQWHSAETMPTLEYRVPGAVERKYMHNIVATLPQNRSRHWIMLEACEWDYSWVPDPGDPAYIYVFGNQWWPAEKWPTVEYHVDGATERKYMDYPVAKLLPSEQHWTNLTDRSYTFDYSWRPDPGDPPYRYIFGNQWHRAEVMPTVEWTHPEANDETQIKFVDWPTAELQPDKTRWTVPAGVNPDTVDFSWVPDPGEPPYIYQFATQHQKTGGPVYTVPGATETKYLENLEIKIEVETVPIVEIDHMDGNAGNIPGVIKKIRYFDNYRDTLIRLAKSLQGEHEFVWVCSSICDYSGFDFTWHPEKWQQSMLHVFASNDQKFGDTFYMHVPTFAERAEKKALLEWYSVNYVPRKSVPRRPMPVIEHTQDTHVEVIKNTDWAGPLALFTTNSIPITMPAVSLWREETKTIVPLSNGASSVIVPKNAKGSIKTQLYDYPYINKTESRRHGDQPLDIVFIENGEPNAADNWMMLENRIINLEPNRLHRVSGVKGRAAAYHAAARASTTPWFFAVFAKLSINLRFSWNWQPDRMQQAKHYIFHAENPVNGLVYGHQAMIAYNRELVLNNPGQGLDFTLDSPHEVVPLVSGTAEYAYTPWMAWRTAFREALKLRASLPDVENEYRLSRWLSVNPDGESIANEDWSRWGAEDAVEYYEEVQGNFDALKKSYEWDWLASYAFMKRSLVPDR